ncbi:hypothetical protein DUNSADRAFT_11110 [Dunaliella salina]|uniref:Cyclic nucleotide-binding domain-containing protein n=1 Tax=Dunaliella salina TaxID=3046 RepID=A0ABQ7H4K2_DUNSA|nr:hypothetical protein DUNSADRAFT_11110 [Dunaliella salina]|eukprot:KAF5841794.1 hypothetical protein DUNSADRAFT_11110 [Dunaliella salina]
MSEHSLGRQSGGGISFGARSACSAKSRAPSTANLASDDEGSEVSTVDSRLHKQRSPTGQEPEQQQPSHARLTAGVHNMGVQVKRDVPVLGQMGTVGQHRELRGVAFGLGVNFREQEPRDRKTSHSRKPSAAESSQSVAFGLDVNFREQEPRNRKASHSRKPSAAESSQSMAPLPLAPVTNSNTDYDATITCHHQSPSDAHNQHTRSTSHTGYQSVASGALAASPDGQSPPPKLLSCLSGRSRGDGSKSHTRASGGVAFEGAQGNASWEGMNGGVRKRAPPSLLSAATGRRSCSLSYMLRPTYLMDLSNMEPKARSTPEEAKLAHYLSCVPALAHLPCEIRIKLSRSLYPRSYTSGDVIIRQGLPSDGM